MNNITNLNIKKKTESNTTHNEEHIVCINTVLQSFEQNTKSQHNYKIKATIVNITHSADNYYLACTSCHKKIESNLYCKKCIKTNLEECYIYKLPVAIRDYSNEQWLIFLNYKANKLLGIKPDEYRRWVINGETQKLNDLSNKLMYKDIILEVTTKMRVYDSNETNFIDVINFEFIDKKKDQLRINSLLDKILG